MFGSPQDLFAVISSFFIKNVPVIFSQKIAEAINAYGLTFQVMGIHSNSN